MDLKLDKGDILLKIGDLLVWDKDEKFVYMVVGDEKPEKIIGPDGTDYSYLMKENEIRIVEPYL